MATAAVRALTAISRSCTIEFADHMLSNDGITISELVKIARNETGEIAFIYDPGMFTDTFLLNLLDHCDITKKNALIVLQNLTLQACARPTLGAFDGIKLFVEKAQSIVNMDCNTGTPQQIIEGPLPENAFPLVSSLCYCCREAINRWVTKI